jgi:hypothetical protein
VSDIPPSETAQLAEYAALRAEIAQRSSFQQALIALNLTSAATVFGFVLTKHASEALILLVPVTSSTLGLLWLDHHRNIQLLATYTRQNWPGNESWEQWRAGRPLTLQGIVYFIAVAIVFGVAGIGSLVVGWPAGSHVGEWALCVAGLVLTVLFVGSYVAAVVVTFRH